MNETAHRGGAQAADASPAGTAWVPRLVGLGLVVLASLCPARAQDQRGRDPVGMAVTVEKAHRECFADTVRVAGTLVPREESLARPDVDGQRITQVLVEDGAVVTEGQALARLARPEGQPGQGPSATTVQAPAAGTVIGSTAQLGAIASMSGPPLFRIVVGREIELQADVPLVRVAKLKAAQPARVEVAGVGEVEGRVRAISTEADMAAQSTRVRIFIGKDDRLRVGTFADAIVDAGTICAATISLSAILYGPLGPIVQVVRNNTIETRPVPVGLISGDKVQISEGLNEGDLVVARAGSFLREGDTVRPMFAADAN
ncbi:MAG TPA: efflux RND transporter periplasmic adaptor subunit [Xanthobacteraceae bacterium]|nr:efflux RND transporter periplasmic adaptor subunit [Xanthobacteraceae bacterium]